MDAPEGSSTLLFPVEAHIHYYSNTFVVKILNLMRLSVYRLQMPVHPCLCALLHVCVSLSHIQKHKNIQIDRQIVRQMEADKMTVLVRR